MSSMDSGAMGIGTSRSSACEASSHAASSLISSNVASSVISSACEGSRGTSAVMSAVTSSACDGPNGASATISRREIPLQSGGSATISRREIPLQSGGAGLSESPSIVKQEWKESKCIQLLPLKRRVCNGSITEPCTGFQFPIQLSSVHAHDDASRVLAGVGILGKTLLSLKMITVYAFGLYVKPETVRSVLGNKYAGVSPDVLKRKPEFYDDLLSNELDLTVRLVVHYRWLRMEQVRRAFSVSLRNRLRKITGSDNDDGLKSFFEYLRDDLKMNRGTVIDFRWQPGGRLSTEVGGKELGTIVSPSLCRAFFDMYIGELPVLQSTKEEIGESFAHILNS